MSNPLDSKNFGLKIYNRFPPKYREDDIEQNYSLKRYLEALSDGGYSLAIEDINGLTALIDPDKVDAKFLPILFEQYGLPIFNGIPESYLRYLLPKLSEAYEQKGSITVIEFITSAISGVKVIIEVVDMEVNIKFEMDYNLGDDYFPDVGQFGRIIDKFLPFYFGRNLIYVYVFYENQVLRSQDTDLMEVHDTKEESVGIPFFKVGIPTLTNEMDKLLNEDFILNPESDGVEVDAFKDVIKYVFSESMKLRSEEDDIVTDNIIMFENSLVDVEEDTLTETLTTVYAEVPKLWSRGRRITNSALMGEAVMGESILGMYGEYADLFEDIMTYDVEEAGRLLQDTEAYLNDSRNMLNTNFYTNGTREAMEYSYDVVTINGEQTTIIH